MFGKQIFINSEHGYLFSIQIWNTRHTSTFIYLFITQSRQKFGMLKLLYPGTIRPPSAPPRPAKDRCACAAEYLSQGFIALMFFAFLLYSELHESIKPGHHHSEVIFLLSSQQRIGTILCDFESQCFRTHHISISF